jgi:hypothetical protein
VRAFGRAFEGVWRAFEIAKRPTPERGELQGKRTALERLGRLGRLKHLVYKKRGEGGKKGREG